MPRNYWPSGRAALFLAILSPFDWFVFGSFGPISARFVRLDTPEWRCSTQALSQTNGTRHLAFGCPNVSPMKWSSPVDSQSAAFLGALFSSAWPLRWPLWMSWRYAAHPGHPLRRAIPFHFPGQHTRMKRWVLFTVFAYIPATAPTDGWWRPILRLVFVLVVLVWVSVLVTMGIRSLKAPWLYSGQIGYLTCSNAAQISVSATCSPYLSYMN